MLNQLGIVVRFSIFTMLLSTSLLAADERPNIILIMADDAGVETIGCYGGTSYETPAIDKLASEGIRFSHAYSQPLCTNTRVQLMTGLYNNRNWQAFGILDPAAHTFGHALKAAGYNTCIAGKWQLHSYDPPDYPGASLRRNTGMKVENAGFDEICIWHKDHTEDKGSRYANPTIFQNGKLRDDLVGKYGPYVWVDFIENYLKKQAVSKETAPFFIYYPMALPHKPMNPTPRSDDWKHADKRLDEDLKYFGDMIETMDECVGRVVSTVDTLKLGRNTLILFYSDNGTHQSVTSQTTSGPVAGGKGLTIDAGVHVPMIARWVGKIKPGLCDDLIDSTDFFPTLLEAAGAKPPAEPPLDGVSFYPQLTGSESQPRDYIFCHYDPRPGWDKDQFGHSRFVRNHQYKLYDDGRLFNTRRDPLEQHPVAVSTQNPVARRVRQQFGEVLKSMPNPESPARDPLHFKPTAQTRFVSKKARLELLWGEGSFTEGPAVASDGQVLFTDIRNNRIMVFNPDTNKTRVFRENSGSANGLAFTRDGLLLNCEGADGGGRRLSMTMFDKITETLVDNWRGKKLNSPNDVTVSPAGVIYFTDPRYRGPESREIDFEGVFMVEKKKAILATKEVERPNGIAISADGKHAYISDNNNDYSGAHQLLAFDINKDGTFANKRVLFDFGSGRRGIDGMTLDPKGNIYATAGAGRNAGVYIFGPKGEHLAKIPVPDLPTNCTFGNEPGLLYITAQTPAKQGEAKKFGLYRIRLK